ncbi:hypothetical protein B0T24DRAFT_580545 [Lasiosphaeria ovina]|uniref:Uncharacterized protein n=1 Tax=Lasiosphaeria ovina TaxID=92902 RepID=A0AAE0K3Y5_9PEZI|nr:hypothetical protein B0T24DRAFT_580545 [Lasiosphaeria ovina]
MNWNRRSLRLGLAVLALAVGAVGQDSTEWSDDGWLGEWKSQQLILGSDIAEACETSRVSAFEMSKGRKPVRFSTSPTDNWELPRIVPMNETAGEQWEFDAVSDDGLSGLIFGFYRDPNYSVLGSGNLRMYVEFAFPDGERFVQIDYPGESIIESCRGAGTRGEWRGDGYSYVWEVSDDMRQSRVVWNTPKTSGTLVLRSVAPPRYADGTAWPSTNASLLTVPHFYWTEPIPVAEVTVDAVVEGKKVAWSGIGGHERLWGAFNWLTCLDSMHFVRLQAGPYALTFWDFESWLYKGLHVPSVVLAEDGAVVFDSRRTEPSETDDFFTWSKLYDTEGVTGKLRDKATGFVIDLSSPTRGQQWTFLVTHKNVYFEYFLGGGVGGTGYTATVIGGQVGMQRQWAGVGVTEVLKLPEQSLVVKRNYVG